MRLEKSFGVTLVQQIRMLFTLRVRLKRLDKAFLRRAKTFKPSHRHHVPLTTQEERALVPRN